VPDVGESMNAILYREKGWAIYRGVKARIGKAMMVAGARRLDQFTKPVEMYFSPRLGPKRRKFDVTNYTMFCKMFEDWLVEWEILRGDTSEYVKGLHISEPLIADDGVERMIVRIVEIELPEIPEQARLDLAEELF